MFRFLNFGNKKGFKYTANFYTDGSYDITIEEREKLDVFKNIFFSVLNFLSKTRKVDINLSTSDMEREIKENENFKKAWIESLHRLNVHNKYLSRLMKIEGFKKYSFLNCEISDIDFKREDNDVVVVVKLSGYYVKKQ